MCCVIFSSTERFIQFSNVMFTCRCFGFQDAAYNKTKEEGDLVVLNAIKSSQLKGTLRFTLEVALCRFWFCCHLLVSTPK